MDQVKQKVLSGIEGVRIGSDYYFVLYARSHITYLKTA